MNVEPHEERHKDKGTTNGETYHKTSMQEHVDQNIPYQPIGVMMNDLPLPLRWYLFAVLACALMITAIAFGLSPRLGPDKITPFFLFLGLISLVHFVPVRYTGRMMLSLSTTIGIAAAWILPPIEVILIMTCGCLFREITRLKWYRIAFNICQDIISVGGTAVLFSFVADAAVPHSWMQLVWIAVVGIFYIGASMGVLGTVITLSNPSEYSWQRWKQNILGVFTYIDVTLFVCGVVLGVLWFASAPAFALGLALLSTMYWSLRSNADVHQASTHRLQIQEALTHLLSTSNVGQQLELLLKQLWHLVPVERAGIVLFGPDGNEGPVIVASGDVQDLHLICSRPEILHHLSEQREIRRIEQELPYAEHCKLPVLLVPLHTSDTVVGAMVIVLHEHTVGTLDLRFLTTYAAQATLAVVQARLINNLQTSQEQLVHSERLAAVGTLAASVAHEFNNVLAIICNTAEAAVLQPDPVAQRRALNIVSTTAKRGGSITHGLLTFTRQIEPRRELVQIEDAIQPVLAMLESRFRNEQIRLVKELSPVAPLTGDVGLLSQAVLNLVTNALDAMPTGGTLTIRLWQEQQTIRLSVQDTGIGIPDEIRAKLFEPFTTTKHADQPTIGGSGLGLAITYGIVTSHSGTVEVESGADRGTAMIISLPAAEGLSAPSIPSPTCQQVDGPLRVMVVDDEPLIGMGLAQILEQDGHQVAWFDDPEQAFAAINDQSPDLLIADIHMPKLDGLALLRRTRQQHPTMRQILITGQMHAHQRSEVLALGAEVVSKPFSATDIRAVLGQVRPFTPALAVAESSEHQRIRNNNEHRLRDDLRHRLLNHVSALESMFRMNRRAGTDPTAQALAMRYFAQTIGELSVFVRAQQVLGLLDQTGNSTRLRPAPFRLDLLLAEAADWIVASCSDTEPITITVACPPSLELAGDAKSLLTALLAALQNSRESIRRSGAGEHTITLTAEHHGSDLIVTVEDTGRGFLPSLLDQLKHDLDGGDGAHLIGALQSRYGLGLGISLMIRVARLHSGSVTFGNRQEDVGAWVQLRLPVEASGQTAMVNGEQARLNVLAA